MALPKVRELQTLIKTQQKALQPQLALIDQDIATNATAGAAQEAGLAAQKDTAFGQIEQGAENKGMFFSGASPDEQYKYTAGTYLPKLAELQAAIAMTRSNLMGKKAELNYGAFTRASDIHEKDRDFLNSWKKMTAEQKFSASEADKQRAFQAQQAQIERGFTASQNAAERAYALADAALADKKVKKIVKNIGGFLDRKKGADKKVSPQVFQAGRQKWVAAGGTPEEYSQLFYGFVNTSHAGDYF